MTAPPLHPDFRPTANWDALRLWAVMLARLRRFFAERGFIEVQTPLLSADTVIDRHLDPFRVEDAGRTLWLQTSPEFAMKRLLASGAPAIYQVTRSFRQGECGPLHNPEFTIVEWYRPGDGLEEGMILLSDLAEAMLGRGPAERVSYRDAFILHAGVDPLAADVASLRRAAAEHGVATPESLDALDRDGWFDLLLVGLVAPHLGRTQPTILFDYPPSQAALARVRPDTQPVAERFELFVDGIELANGYHELTDAAELRRRNAEANHRREQDGKMPLPEESRLLAAMDRGLPSAAGVALGFDRLVMLAAGAKTLAAVTPFPWDRA
ncbi:MAG: EF-P lysine aminoacylase GenX [Pirellulales bacterium]|nr:EF-P lysine aminoacylase GenX [Pirellulales bacterium]